MMYHDNPNRSYPQEEMYCGTKEEPTFDEVADLAPGVYSAKRLNPPSGKDCTHLLVRADGTLGWCNADGESESRFSVAELASGD